MENNEIPVVFGPDGTLVGMATLAAGAVPGSIGCLLLNTGVNPRMGPRRLNVKIARELAQAGIPALRFDLSGVGDSRSSGGQSDFRQQALVDMKAALDQLQLVVGVRQFIVFGNCSGAGNALSLALADPRIVGALMLDGYTYLSKEVRIRRKLRRWAAFPFNPSIRRSFRGWSDWMAWASAPLDPEARKRALGRISGRTEGQSTEETGIFDADAPYYGPADFERDITLLADRGVDVNLMFSATHNSVDHDRDLLSELRGAPFLERVRYKFWPDIDHTVTTLAAQRKLLAAIREWAVEVAGARRDVEVAPRRAAPVQLTQQPVVLERKGDTRLAA